MFVDFNQGASTVVTGTDQGFDVFDVPPASSFRRRLSERNLGAIRLVTILHDTPLLAVVGAAQGTNRFLLLYDAQKNEVMTEMHFDTAILAVRMNLKRLVVILEKTVHLFDLNTLAPLPQIKTVRPLNSKGLGSLSALNESDGSPTCYFAFPHTDREETRGDVLIMNAISLNHVQVVPAHQHPIALLELCSDGTRLATCSVKGTTIRVFSTSGAQPLFTFRRGMSPASIDCLAFSPQGDMLAASYDSGTLHLFRAADGTLSTEIRSFAKLSIPEKSRTICALDDACSTLSVVTLPDSQVKDAATTLAQYSLAKDKPKLINEYPLM